MIPGCTAASDPHHLPAGKFGIALRFGIRCCQRIGTEGRPNRSRILPTLLRQVEHRFFMGRQTKWRSSPMRTRLLGA